MAFTPSGKLYVSAAEQWTALRRMYEQFGVPLDVMQPLAKCEAEFFFAKAKREGWVTGSTARTMLARMSAAIDRQLTAFQISTEDICSEKQVRSLSLMAKTLETIATVEKRLGAGETNKGAKEGAGDPELDDKRAVAAHLEAELAALVEANS